MLMKEREMFVKEGMLSINWLSPIEVSSIIGGGEPLKICNELGSKVAPDFKHMDVSLRSNVISCSPVGHGLNPVGALVQCFGFN